MRRKSFGQLLALSVILQLALISLCYSQSYAPYVAATGNLFQIDNKNNVIALHFGSVADELVKINGKTGANIWKKDCDQDYSFDYLWQISKTGDILVVLWSVHLNKSGNPDTAFIAKYKGANGTQIWKTEIPETYGLVPTQVVYAFDKNGDVILYSSNQIIAKYSGSDGSVIFESP